MTFGSLFAGIGGLDLGLERAGLVCRWQVEINPFSRDVLAKHWPTVRRFEDVRAVGRHNLEPVDLICGGFPCQDISNAGNRKGIKGERSGLWVEYRRIVRELRPRYVLVENVAALLVRGVDTVLGDLSALGFDAEWGVLRARDVGAPHRRARLFIVAYTEHNSWRDLEQRDLSGQAIDGQEPREASARRLADASGLLEREAGEQQPGRHESRSGGPLGLADADGAGLPERVGLTGVRGEADGPFAREAALGHCAPGVADAALDGRRPNVEGREQRGREAAHGGREGMADGDGSGRRPVVAGLSQGQPDVDGRGLNVADADGGRREGERIEESRGLERARGRVAHGRGDDRRIFNAAPRAGGRWPAGPGEPQSRLGTAPRPCRSIRTGWPA